MDDPSAEPNTNIDTYTIKDILTLLNLPPATNGTYLTETQVNQASSKIINKLNREKKYTLADFFEKARVKLLKSLQQTQINSYNEDGSEEEEEEDEEEETDDDYDTTYPPTTALPPLHAPQTLNPNEMNKYTNREHQVKVQNATSHFAMNQERLGIVESYPVPVLQGTLNPNLTNIVNRTVSIDSQYRQNILPYAGSDQNLPAYNTDYTLDLTDTLTNVLSLTLNSIHIPTTWYVFDKVAYGNTCFDCSGHLISIQSGNYKAIELVNALNASISSFPDISNIDLSYNVNTNKVSFINTSPTQAVTLTFYQSSSALCSTTGCGAGQKINQHLGWNLGFRIEPDALTGNVTLVLPPGITQADAPLNVYGSKYFLLVIDDYNNNHLNQGLVNINATVSKLDVPQYYNNYVKNQKSSVSEFSCTNVSVNGSTITVPTLRQTFPRNLTQAQLYTTNEILSNRKMTLNNRTSGATNSDVLALLPLIGISALRPDPFILLGTSLQESKRTYFGPVTIERMRVRLLDDRGNLVNLNDNDWSFSLITEQLYQY